MFKDGPSIPNIGVRVVPVGMRHMVHGINMPSEEALRMACTWESMDKAKSVIEGRFNNNTLALLTPVTKTTLCNKLSKSKCGYDIEKRIVCDDNDPYRSIDGTCNNLINERWGSAPRAFERYVPADYFKSNGFRRNRKNKVLPNARKVSNLMAEATKRPTPQISIMLMQWGQFLNHDINVTPQRHDKTTGGLIQCCGMGNEANGEETEDCRHINVQHDDFYSTHGVKCIGFVRSLPANKACDFEELEQVNGITAFVDASNVYGSSVGVAGYLRTKSGGRLNTTDNNSTGKPMPPKGGIGNAQSCPIGFEPECFLGGDARIDMVPNLIVMHTAFIRLHNIIADQLSSLNNHWEDEDIYQETRRIVGALAQQITYRDWLPIVLGPTIMAAYNLNVGSFGYSDTYDSTVDPTIKNAFAASAFRFGHSLVGDILKAAVDENNFDQADHFFDINVLDKAETSPSSMLKGLARCPMEAADTVVGDALRNKLFTNPKIFGGSADGAGLDLVSINLMRGRDHGVPGYSKWRKFCGLKVITNIREMKKVMKDDIAIKFKNLYKKRFEDIDLFAAGLAEDSIEDGILGPTFSCIIAHQFADLKHGDRFWYERKDQPKPFTPAQLSAIRQTSLASILCAVTEGLHGFQANPFRTTDWPGNEEMDCNHYNFIDLSYWQEPGHTSTTTGY